MAGGVGGKRFAGDEVMGSDEIWHRKVLDFIESALEEEMRCTTPLDGALSVIVIAIFVAFVLAH